MMVINDLFVHRINNCVGELNQKYFIQFLFYTGEFELQHIFAAATTITLSITTFIFPDYVLQLNSNN